MKFDSFQKNFPLKVLYRKLISTKKVFKTHLQKVIRHLNLNLRITFSAWKINKAQSNLFALGYYCLIMPWGGAHSAPHRKS